jgi:hypothetical protein
LKERSAINRGVRDRRRYRPGCGCGCSSVIVVLIIGLLLSLFNLAISIGVSLRVPFTESNLTLAGSVGQKQKAVPVLPNYVEGRVGGNQNLINQSSTLTIGPAEGTAVIVLGKQPGAPIIDLHLEAR